mgnify:CR=1 FL=1
MKNLPWTHDGNGLIFGQCAEDDDEAPLIADVITDRERAPFGIMTDAEREHAEFICRAANTHTQLIAAVKLALLALNTAPRFRVRGTDSYAIASALDDALSEGGAS